MGWHTEIRSDPWEDRKAAALNRLQRLHDGISTQARMENPAAVQRRDALADLLGYLHNNGQGVIGYSHWREQAT